MRVYKDALVGTVPRFPRDMEGRIDAYLAGPADPEMAAAGSVPTSLLATASVPAGVTQR